MCFCVFSNPRKNGSGMCFVCFCVFSELLISGCGFVFFLSNLWEKLPRNVFYVFLCFFSELLIVWAGYSCIDTVLIFLWYCDVGWVKIYRCGSTKYLWRTGAMKARVSSSNLSLFLAIFAIFSIISFAFLLPTILYHWHSQTGDCSLWACWKNFLFLYTHNQLVLIL